MRKDHRDMAFPPVGGVFNGVLNGVLNSSERNPLAN
jgi:hypothetical protein